MARVWCDWTADNLLVIPDADFDPQAHRLYDEVIAAQAKKAPAGGDDEADADKADAGPSRARKAR